MIRFRRAVNFPCFGMTEGERWSFVVYGKSRQRLDQERLPLLADLVPPAPTFDVEAEQRARDAAHVRFTA